jgi:hypothetical protein
MRFRALLAGALLVGCGGESGSNVNEPVVKGAVQNGVIALPVSIEGSPTMPFVLDTGSPLTLVDPNKFPSVETGFTQAATVDVGSVHLMNVEIVGKTPCGLMMCPASEPAGLLGGDALIDFAITIDYAAAAVSFGAYTFPTNIAEPVTSPFKLQGGGQIVLPGMNGTVDLPATRIVLDVAIEGTVYPFVLDTGSSALVLAPDLYDSIVSDGRAQSSVSVSTVSGTRTEPSTRLSAVSISTATQTSVEAIRAPLDLGTLSREVGQTIEGLVGGGFLSHYVVTIDYPTQTLTLRAYQ